MRIIECEQNTPEWYAARAGKFTASVASHLMAKRRDGLPSTQREKLIARLAMERVSGKPTEQNFYNAAMRRGHELEADALAMYSFEEHRVVTSVGFCLHDTIDYIGCSPDGLADDDGLVQIKCPQSEDIHQQYLLTGKHTKEYGWQVKFEMLVTGRKWCDVTSYDPRVPYDMRLAIKRVDRLNTEMDDLMIELARAEQKVQERVRQLEACRGH